MEFKIIYRQEEWDNFIKRLAYNGGFAPYQVCADSPPSFPVIAAYMYINGEENEGWIVETTDEWPKDE